MCLHFLPSTRLSAASSTCSMCQWIFYVLPGCLLHPLLCSIYLLPGCLPVHFLPSTSEFSMFYQAVCCIISPSPTSTFYLPVHFLPSTRMSAASSTYSMCPCISYLLPGCLLCPLLTPCVSAFSTFYQAVCCVLDLLHVSVHINYLLPGHPLLHFLPSTRSDKN